MIELMQLFPLITIKYEEDNIDLSQSESLSDPLSDTKHPQKVASGSGWCWLVVSGRIYLVDPQKNVWYSPSVTSLLQKVYLK